VIREHIEAALATKGCGWPEFSELMIRLIDHGVLCRDESKKEAELYDRYQQLAELVEDYLSVLDIRIQHDRQFHMVRLFPPGAEVPGLPDTDSAFNTGLRERLNQAEVALVLVLRAEYDKALREGSLDEEGNVLLSMEALNLAAKNLLGRALPEAITERRALFRRLRQLRLIRSSGEEDLKDTEIWITIRPGITSFVTASVLAQLSTNDTAPATDTPALLTDESEDD
jgi:hypothetical protein